MEFVLKDSFGTVTNIGDEVAFVTTGRCHSVNFNRGTVVGVSKSGGLQVKYIRDSWYRRGEETTTTLQLNRFIKLNPPKPAWQWLGTHETSSSRK